MEYEDQTIKVSNNTLGLIALFTLVMMLNTCSIKNYIAEDVQVQREQLEVAKRQYTLDSLMYYNR